MDMKKTLAKLTEVQTKPKANKKVIKEENNALSLKKLFNQLSEDAQGSKPVAVMTSGNKQTGTGVMTSQDPDVKKILQSLNPAKVQVVMPQQSGQPNQQTNQNQQQNQNNQNRAPSAAPQANQTVSEDELDEKIEGGVHINPEKRGMFNGKNKSELMSQYNNLKASGPHKKGSPAFTKMKELAFAIRAKSGWGKVKEVEQMYESKIKDLKHGMNRGGSLETERIKHPVGQRPKGIGWSLKSAGEQTGKDHSVWERKFKRVPAPTGLGDSSKNNVSQRSYDEEVEQIDEANIYQKAWKIADHVNGSKHFLDPKSLDVQAPGHTVWKRGDGSSYRDPGKIHGHKDSVSAAWNHIKSLKGAKPVGHISGEHPSLERHETIKHDGIHYTNKGNHIAYGAASRTKNSNVWNLKKEEAEQIDEANIYQKAWKIADHVKCCCETKGKKMCPVHGKKKVKEGDQPTFQGRDTMGAGLGAGRSQTTLESRAKADNKAEKAGKKVTKDLEYDMHHTGKNDKKAEKAGKKVTKDIEYDEKKKMKKKKSKLKESHNHRLEAAHHLGKAHALAGQGYGHRFDEGSEEHRMYHEGYKAGLDECYGKMMPIHGLNHGVHDEMDESHVVDDMASYGAHALEEEDTLDEVSRGEYIDQQKANAKHSGKHTAHAFGQDFPVEENSDPMMAFESWDAQLTNLLTEYNEINEGLSVSVSDQEGMPKSVSVTATDHAADELLGLVKSAGLGMFGHGGESHGEVEVVEPMHLPSKLDVVDDHDGMMSLIKKMSGPIGHHGNPGDYEDEAHDGPQSCNECGLEECNCGNKMMDEGEEPEDNKKDSDYWDRVEREESCPRCGGSGGLENRRTGDFEDCSSCGGSGIKSRYRHMEEATECNECGVMECNCPEKMDEVETEDQAMYQVAEDDTQPQNPPDDGSANATNATKGNTAQNYAGAMTEEGLEESRGGVWQEVVNALSAAYPDLDPTDSLKPVMRKHGLSFRQLDDLAREHDYNGVDDFVDELKEISRQYGRDTEDGSDLEESEKLDEWANKAGPGNTVSDTTFEQDIEFMTKVIAGGLNKPKRDQTTLPHTLAKPGLADDAMLQTLRRLNAIEK